MGMHLCEERGERHRLLLPHRVEQVVGAALDAALDIPVCLAVAYEVEPHLGAGGEGSEGCAGEANGRVGGEGGGSRIWGRGFRGEGWGARVGGRGLTCEPGKPVAIQRPLELVEKSF